MAPLRYARRLARLLADNPGFGFLLFAESFINFYAEFSYIALPFVLIALTDSPAWAGAMATAGTLPLLLASGPAGWAVDRMSPRRVMLATAVVRGLLCVLIATLGTAGHLTPPLLVAICFLMGVCGAFQLTGKRTLIPSLLPHRALPAANSVDEAAFGLAETFGTLLAGFTVAALGAHATLLIQAALQGGFFLALLKVPDVSPPQPAPAERGLGEGVRYLLGKESSSRLLRAVLGVAMGVHACAMGFFALQVFYFRIDMGLDSRTIGWILCASSAAGIAGSLATERAMERIGAGGSILLFSLMVPAGLFAVAFSSNLGAVVAGASLILVGAKSSRIIRNTLCQVLSPRSVLGRVNGVSQTLVDGMTPLAAFATGALAKWLGFPAAYALAGLAALAFCGYYFATPLRTLGPSDTLAPAGAGALADAKAL